MRWRRAIVGAAVLLAVGAFAGPRTLAAADEPLRVTEAVNATEDDPNPSRMYASPALAMDPNNPFNVVAVAAEIRNRTCGLVRSSDAGQTWVRPDALPTLDSYPFCFQTETGPRQAAVAFGRDGDLYYAYDGWDDQDTLSDWPIGRGGGWRGNVSVLVSRSADLGESWDTTVVRDARGLRGDEQENNRPVSTIAVDTVSGSEDVVYVAWKVTYRDRQSLRLAVSTDGGRSFAEPVDLTAGYFDDGGNRRRLAEGAEQDGVPGSDEVLYYWPDLTVDADGTVYAVWNARFGPGPQMDDTGVFLSTSTDQGQTFTVTELSPAPETWRYPMLEWTEEGGPEGTLHLVYEGATPQEIDWLFDLYHRSSTDRGATWTEPTRLSDEPPEELAGQYHPDLAIAPGGRIDVAWWDFRNDNGNFANDVYLASSHDNGATWSANVRVTDRSISRRIGVWYGNADIRQPPGIVATDAYTVMAWDDTRNGDETTHTQDIYSSIVQHNPLRPNVPPGMQYGLAGAAGLGVFGVVLLVLGVVHKRRG